jgi:uncharacterized protein DUF559
MHTLPREVVTLLHHGVTGRKDVKERVGRAQYEAMLTRGLVCLGPGRLLIAPGFTDQWTPLVVTQLRCPMAVASGRLACWLWQLPPFTGLRPPAQEWISPARCHLEVVRQVRPLEPWEITCIGGLRVTSPARTLLDLAAIDEGLLERAGERMLYRREVTEEALWQAVESFNARHGVAGLRRFLTRRGRGTPPCESDLEVLALQAIRRLGYPEPTYRQYPVPRDDGGNYRVDFAWVVGRRTVFVEIDGPGHADPDTLAYADRRQNVLTRRRAVVLRFVERDVRELPCNIDRELSVHVRKLRACRAG